LNGRGGAVGARFHRLTHIDKRRILGPGQYQDDASDVLLLSNDYRRLASPSHIYVFVNIKKDPLLPQFFVRPSAVVATKGNVELFGKQSWSWLNQEDVAPGEQMGDINGEE
jgi:hypothetical protein